MDGGVTRSLYIGRDKALEVLKRREAVERELQAKREAKIREQCERMERAAQQKEAELRDRARQKHQREMERQKAFLDRRCAQMERQNAKKTELLKRAHQSASRIATLNQAKKSVYAFGSSTPRKLGFLDNVEHQQRDSGPRSSPVGMRGSTPSLAQRPSATAPTTSRFQNPLLDGKAGSTAMNRSVIGTLGDGDGTLSNRQTHLNKPPTQPAKQTPNAIKKQRKIANEGGILNNAAMTQSLYSQNTSRMAAAQGSAQKAPMTKPTPKKRLPPPFMSTPRSNIQAKSDRVPIVQNKKIVVDGEQRQPPPVIRPKKAQQQQSNSGSLSAQEEETNVVLTNAAESVIPEQLEQEEIKFTDSKEQIGNTVFESDRGAKEDNSLGAALAEISEAVVIDRKEDDGPIDIVEEATQTTENLPGQDIGRTLFDELIGAEIRHFTETRVHDVANELLLEKQNSHSNDVTFTTDTSFYSVRENPSIEEVSMFEHIPMPESEPTVTTPKLVNPPVLSAIPSQEEKDERRRHIKEILARTRQDITGPPNMKNNGITNVISGGSALSAQPSMPTSASNPLLPQRDASTLAQNIHAKYRHKFQKQQPKGSEMTGNSQANVSTEQQAEIEVCADTDASEGTFCLPGQIVSAISHATSLTIFSKNAEEPDNHMLLKQHPSPPDDPLINGLEINGKEFHPPEPTTTNAQTS